MAGRPKRVSYFDQRQAGYRENMARLIKDYRSAVQEHGIEDGTLRMSGALLQQALTTDAGALKALGTYCELLTFAVTELSDRKWEAEQ